MFVPTKNSTPCLYQIFGVANFGEFRLSHFFKILMNQREKSICISELERTLVPSAIPY